MSAPSTTAPPARDALRWLLVLPAFPLSGLLVGSAIVRFAVTLPALALQGLVTGALIGTAQAIALPRSARRLVWALGVTALWTLGWVTTTLVGVDVDVEQQYAVFGASGALVAALAFTALAAVALPSTGARSTSPHPSTPASAVREGAAS